MRRLLLLPVAVYGTSLPILTTQTGCGYFNGVWDQRSCYDYYPTDCLFGFSSTQPQSTYNANVAARTIQQLVLPASSVLATSSPYALHNTTNPLVYVPTGEALSGCVVTEVYYTDCIKESATYSVTCTLEDTYVDLNANPSTLTSTFTKSLSMAGQYTFADTNKAILSMSPLPSTQAVSFANAVLNTATYLKLTCNVGGAPVNSCLLFEAVPTNESPSISVGTDLTAYDIKYRFTNPPIPALVYNNVTDLTPASGDRVINEGNPIVAVDGKAITYCEGENSEYQGEDGVFNSVFLGSDGAFYNTSHILYISGPNISSSTFQQVWSTLPELTEGRAGRMLITCWDDLGANMGTGEIYFGTTFSNSTSNNVWNITTVTTTFFEPLTDGTTAAPVTLSAAGGSVKPMWTLLMCGGIYAIVSLFYIL